ncbi:MAG: T9SS type A sorting domain-containing protein [Saprospiraceae bacterium]
MKNNSLQVRPVSTRSANRSCIFSACLLFFNVHLAAQPFEVGHTALTFTDPARNNRSVPCEIYYPADSAGDNVPLAAQGGAFPVVSFGHGFVMTWEAYQNIWEAVVPEGFILVFPNTETNFSPSHQDFGLDLAFAVARVRALGQDAGSLLFNRTGTTSCVMGHSMGGGASFLAAQSDTSISAIATLAPAETSTSAIQAAADLQIPALIFAGSNDCVTPPGVHQLPMYDALSSICKTYISITGGSHCQMANNNLLCSIGEASCTPAPAISRAEQHLIIGRYLLPWLKFQLKGDCPAGEVFDAAIATDPAITYQRTCELCPATNTEEMASSKGGRVYPNPFNETLQVFAADYLPSEFSLFDSMGRQVLRQRFTSLLKLDTRWLARGIYFFEIKNQHGTPGKGKLVKE